MSVQAPPPHVPRAPEPAALRCPRCGATVAPEQDWCLECGAPARTRLAPTPNWRLPVVLVAALMVAAGIALAIAFAGLTSNDGTVTATATTTAAPARPTETNQGAVAGTALPATGVILPSSTATPGSTATPAPAGSTATPAPTGP